MTAAEAVAQNIHAMFRSILARQHQGRLQWFAHSDFVIGSSFGVRPYSAIWIHASLAALTPCAFGGPRLHLGF
jgi:hypothetical protein